jgi:hypothetical protein
MEDAQRSLYPEASQKDSIWRWYTIWNARSVDFAVYCETEKGRDIIPAFCG